MGVAAGGTGMEHCTVVDTTHSPFARLRPVSVADVVLDDTFWAPRRRLNREVSLPAQYRYCQETGRIDNFRRAAGKATLPFQGRYYNDSDVYKWLEAVGWTLAADDDPQLETMAAKVIAAIAAAQQPDGYLNTYFALERAGERWTNLRDMHELYCAGHLIQAAIAYARLSRSQGQAAQLLLEVALRLADHVCEVFAADQGQRRGTPGHEEIEMALIELARYTGEARYRAQAGVFLDARGQGLIGGRAYHQDHRPFRDLERLEGHAVRHMYLNCGAADLYAETGEPALRSTLERLWLQMTKRQMYVSGGLGSRHVGESFGADYELPNARAYAETCAAIGSVMWNWRMLLLAGDAHYADVMELALYNGFLAGVSLDGTAYFYENPLADDGTHRRQSWFDCACCPTNAVRLLASLPGYFYATSDEGVWVHLYARSTARVRLPDGRVVLLRQRSRYPWSGTVEIEVEASGSFGLFLRIPGWCQTGASLAINGRAVEGAVALASYAAVRRIWQPGDVVQLSLPMPVRRVRAHPYVLEDTGRVALLRGPLLYCVEGADHPGLDLRNLVLARGLPLSATHRSELLGGVVVLHGRARTVPLDEGWAQQLYRTAGAWSQGRQGSSMELTAIPYYAWANRQPGPMQVWLRDE